MRAALTRRSMRLDAGAETAHNVSHHRRCKQREAFLMGALSMRLSDDLVKKLEDLAEATGRSKSYLAAQAIRDFLDRESWQIAETTQALREADAGDFASDEEVAAVSEKWKNRAV
jgi:predicted transcriptional regulator